MSVMSNWMVMGFLEENLTESLVVLAQSVRSVAQPSERRLAYLP